MSVSQWLDGVFDESEIDWDHQIQTDIMRDSDYKRLNENSQLATIRNKNKKQLVIVYLLDLIGSWIRNIKIEASKMAAFINNLKFLKMIRKKGTISPICIEKLL